MRECTRERPCIRDGASYWVDEDGEHWGGWLAMRARERERVLADVRRAEEEQLASEYGREHLGGGAVSERLDAKAWIADMRAQGVGVIGYVDESGETWAAGLGDEQEDVRERGSEAGHPTSPTSAVDAAYARGYAEGSAAGQADVVALKQLLRMRTQEREQAGKAEQRETE